MQQETWIYQVWGFSNFKSAFLVKIAHLALNKLLKITSASFEQDSYSLMQYGSFVYSRITNYIIRYCFIYILSRKMKRIRNRIIL